MSTLSGFWTARVGNLEWHQAGPWSRLLALSLPLMAACGRARHWTLGWRMVEDSSYPMSQYPTSMAHVSLLTLFLVQYEY